MHADCPLKDIACVLFAQNKRRNDRVCHRVSNNEDTDPHTISNALLVLAMINKGKLYSYQNARFFKQTSQWRRKSWWCNLPAALILWHAGSDVMGCRRPTGGVFKYVSSDTSHAEAFPVATPRGRSSSSHEGEHEVIISHQEHAINNTALHWKSLFVTAETSITEYIAHIVWLERSQTSCQQIKWIKDQNRTLPNIHEQKQDNLMLCYDNETTTGLNIVLNPRCATGNKME